MVAPYYQSDLATLYLGDSEELLTDRWLRTDKPVAQIVVTSPPYNMGLSPSGGMRGGKHYAGSKSGDGARFISGYSGKRDDALPPDVYDDWQRRMLLLMYGSVPMDGAVFYNHRPRVAHGVHRDPLGNDFGGLVLRQRIIWNRGTGIDVQLRSFCTRGEYILLFAKPDFKLASLSASGFGDVWNISPRRVPGHKAPFPIELPQRCIEATNARSVFDPYAGSGTTLLAASLAGIKSVGIEKQEPYCEMIAKRLDALS